MLPCWQDTYTYVPLPVKIFQVLINQYRDQRVQVIDVDDEYSGAPPSACVRACVCRCGLVMNPHPVASPTSSFLLK